MANSTVWESIRALVRQQDVVLAAERLEQLLSEGLDGPNRSRIRNWLDELILHTASIQAIKIDGRKGIISTEDASTSLRQISHRVLSLVNEIEQANLPLPSLQKPLLANSNTHQQSSIAPSPGGYGKIDANKIDATGQAANASSIEPTKRFESALLALRDHCANEKIKPPRTFISYAWGISAQESWVTDKLGPDLMMAGVEIILDRRDNSQIGKNIARFVESIARCDRIVVIGTPGYLQKYENLDDKTGTVVAAEVDVINNRMLGTEAQKETVLPLLLDGDKETSLPPLLRGRVYGDFRPPRSYPEATFDLVLSLYRIPSHHPGLAELRMSLRKQ